MKWTRSAFCALLALTACTFDPSGLAGGAGDASAPSDGAANVDAPAADAARATDAPVDGPANRIDGGGPAIDGGGPAIDGAVMPDIDAAGPPDAAPPDATPPPDASPPDAMVPDATPPDGDGDGVVDGKDVCPMIPDPEQY